MTNTQNPITTTTFAWAAAVGLGRFYGFITREAAEEWVDSHSHGRGGVVCPAALAHGELVAP